MDKSKRVLTICTIANDLSQYHLMRDSFLAAGFDEERCEYRLYDNSARNTHEPFEVLSSVSREVPGRFVVLCHQDIRIDRGPGFDDLLRRLNELTSLDAAWAVAGNHGVTSRLRSAGKVFDPNGTSHPAPLPQQVVSLDENFLVMPAGVPVTCSPGLAGFHLYGTDICLNAVYAGRSCYVIDFELTHLSGGNPGQAAFRRAAAELIEAWNSRFAIAIVGTGNTTVCISRWQRVRSLLQSTKVRRALTGLGINFIAYPGWRRVLRRRVP